MDWQILYAKVEEFIKERREVDWDELMEFMRNELGIREGLGYWGETVINVLLMKGKITIREKYRYNGGENK